MPAITRFREAEAREGKDARGYVYIDGQYCTSVRARTFAGMGLTVDQEISCDQVKRLEKYHFKLQYQGSWEKEKQRIDGVRQRIETICPAVETRVVGFGADTTEFIEAHPETAGKPDLDIAPRGRPDIVLLSIEVTGTEYRRGKGFWVRPDKIAYIQEHPELDIWLALHYAQPEEQLVYIRPDLSKRYPYRTVTINGTQERYVVFDENAPEIKSEEEFRANLISKRLHWRIKEAMEHNLAIRLALVS